MAEHSGRSSASLFDVYLRLRPSPVPCAERFLDVEEGRIGCHPTHITIKPPANDHRKRAIEKFEFTKVFEEQSSQLELFKSTGIPAVIEAVLGKDGGQGRDGLLATLGVTGSGKSHTILGSRSQRGLTQLSMDALYQTLQARLVDCTNDDELLQSLSASDVSESQLMSASTFLELTYGDNTASSRMSRATSRAATPMLVGAFPSIDEATDTGTTRSRAVQAQQQPRDIQHAAKTSQDQTQRPTSSLFPFSLFSRTVPKKPAQDVSFMSIPGASSKKYMPRISTLPQGPNISDVRLDCDLSSEYAVTISMYEVYNDRIFDLLSGQSKIPIQKRRGLLFKSTELSPDRKVVAGLRKVVCASLEEALLVLETGLTERRVAGTGSNAVSSRSHGFFCVEVKKRPEQSESPAWKSSSFTIVDLAGSERARSAKTTGSTLAEAGKINESLMYLGQCMQLQSDNADLSKPLSIVPFRQCKLTELLFSNSFPSTGPTTSSLRHHPHLTQSRRSPQKSIMIVTADPLGDFNATSQILRYSALAREVTVPRIPSVTSTISAVTAATTRPASRNEDIDAAMAEIARLRADLDLLQVRYEDEVSRRREAEASWSAAVERAEMIEAETREELVAEFEARLAMETRRWRSAAEEEREADEARMDKKLDILAKGIEVDVYEDPQVDRVDELEEENARLKQKVEELLRERGMRSPSKKMKVLKARKWEGSGVGFEGSP